MNNDLQYIKILSIFYYVIGALIALVSCLALLYLFIGVMFVTSPPPSVGGPPPPPAIGWFFIVGSIAVMVVGWTWAVALMIAGWHMGKCRHYLYCFVMGCSALLYIPLGTVLGVFTIIVLVRPNAKRLFETGGVVDDEDEEEDFGDRFPRDSYNIRR